MQGEDANDLGRLQSIMQSIELACNSIQMHANPAAAEATILSLSKSPQPYQACKFILENTQVANARFLAATAIRDAALREWGILTSVDKRSLISFCLCFVMQHASLPDGYVLVKVSSVAAQLLKRGWLEFEASEREAFLFQVKQAISGCHGVDVQSTGITFLESLISEFSPETSTAMGLPREFHEQCRMSLELDYLQAFYSWAQGAAVGVADRIVKSDSEVPEARVCMISIHLMLQILNWDFRYSSGDRVKANVDAFSAKAAHDAADSRRSSECILVQPGSSWQKVLLSSGHVGWVLNLYGALRHKFPLKVYWIDCPIAISARKLIVRLCSLTGNVFPADNVQMQEHHLVQLLSGIIQWVHPPDVVSRDIESGKSESELLDGCRALLAVATVTSPFMFDQLLKSICPFGTIALLSSLMSEAVRALMANDTDEETWSWVARDILLDTWIAVLAPSESSNGNPSLPVEGVNAAASLFALIVESELKTASATAYNDDDNDYLQATIFGMDERLSSYGLIARASIEYSVPFLTKVFLERIAQLQQAKGRSDPTAILEELYSLLLITGHVLADEGEGESPLVPEAIQMHFLDIREGDKHPVAILSSSILHFAEQSVDPEIRSSTFSPRLMEAVIWFLSRWSRTYLLSPEGSGKDDNRYDPQPLQYSKKVLLDFFGEHNRGKSVLDVVVRISMTTLLSYPGEKNLQELTCRHLFRGLVGRREINTHLVSLDSWHNLAKSFANERTLLLLTAPHQRSLARTLVLSASGLRNSVTSNQYVRDLLNHMAAYLLDLSGKHDLKEVSQQPETIMVVCCLLERLRGAASASDSCTQKAIYEIGVSVMNPILTLLEVYKNESAVVYLLLKFVVQWVGGQISYLEAQETATLINFSMHLLQIYSSHNIGKISISHSSTLANEEKTEKYKDLRALIQLLSNLCSKDLIDFSSGPIEPESMSIAQVVYVGLHIITPLISIDLLKYPKLCHDYFSLISHMLEVYPEMVGQLNAEALTHTIGTLDFGLRHQDSEIIDKCLAALKALAAYHYKETNAGNVGLGSHASGVKDSGGNVQEGILSRFLPSLLQLLLFEEYSTDLVSAAADALLPLILCEQGLYQRLCNELIEKQTNPTFKTRLASAFHALTSSNQLSSTLDRINYQRFRKNLLNFLIEVRGFLRMV